ncbi:hypothetical protein EVAR_88044_1 [Eumeta japonica]|uniref:DUF4817 domain-containing protein n=1 Tax=Eumeta variegata TaxID=151549 RepID=A0A4C1VET5_EUMVA|nr:hypothetical protein EVAR_88044_1 [Eumeta japonica]
MFIFRPSVKCFDVIFALPLLAGVSRGEAAAPAPGPHPAHRRDDNTATRGSRIRGTQPIVSRVLPLTVRARVLRKTEKMAPHHQYTAKEFTDMLLMYGKCDCNAAKAERMYAERYPNRVRPNSSTILAAYMRVLENKPIVPVREGFESARKITLSVKKEEKILKYFERNSVASLRGAVREIAGVTRAQVTGLLRREGRASYAARKTVPPPAHVDEAGRRIYSRWLLKRQRRDSKFLESILWTGERIFSNYGLLNKKNLTVWAEEKPSEDELLKMKVPKRWGVRVWGAILGDRIYGPIFLPEKLNSHDYLKLINEQLAEIISDLPISTLKRLWFQHDGTPSHCTAPVCERLSELFKKQWIGRKGPVPWPAQSQDFTPIDFFLWTRIKAEVFKRNCDDANEMRKRLRNAFDVIRKECDRRPELMGNVFKDVMLRARACVEGSDQEETEEKETRKLELVENMEAGTERKKSPELLEVTCQETTKSVKSKSSDHNSECPEEAEPELTEDTWQEATKYIKSESSDLNSECPEEAQPELTEDTWQEATKYVKSESSDLNSECPEEAQPELTEDTWQEATKYIKSELSDLNSECAEEAEADFTENTKTEFMDDVKAEPMEIIYLNEVDINIESDSQNYLIDSAFENNI